MKNRSLEELCDSVAQLCDVAETDPSALFNYQKQLSDGVYATVSDLYAKVTNSAKLKLKRKSFYPEKELVDGFDVEQHFQQIALVGKECLSSFIPYIALSEAQTDLNFPVKTVDDELDSRDEIESIADEREEPNDDKNVETTEGNSASSGSEDEESIQDEEDEDLFNFSDVDNQSKSSSDEGKSTGSIDNPDWDQVEPREANEENPVRQSTFEKSRRQLMDKIRTMEDGQLEEKPWQMKGEATATVRPINSLLEEVLEYDATRRPVPVVTEAVTMKLEDIILKRIKDKAFDDVERKIKPVETAFNLKKKIVLDQEKSKLSLAEVYENEYLKQKSKIETKGQETVSSILNESELTEEEKAINNRLVKLFGQLNCLSNFHYTPPPRFAEIEIVSNLPAVNVEEIGRDAVASANLLTADEIAGNFKRRLTGTTEKTKTDKKRERRKKKIRQAKKFDKLRLSTTAVVKSSALGKKKLADPALKSSTQFFQQLETKVNNRVDGKKRAAENDKKSKFKAKKLKL